MLLLSLSLPVGNESSRYFCSVSFWGMSLFRLMGEKQLQHQNRKSQSCACMLEDGGIYFCRFNVSCEIQISALPRDISAVLREVKKVGGMVVKYGEANTENNTREAYRAKIVCKVLQCLSNIFSSLLCKLVKFEFEKQDGK